MWSQAKKSSYSRTLAICVFAFTPMMGAVRLGTLRSVPVYPQMLKATTPRPAFEVATVKPSQPDEVTQNRMGLRDGFFTATHVTLRDLIRAAYQIRTDNQILDLPAWAGNEYFDIQARAAASEIESLQHMATMDGVDQFHLMLQSLLADRFGLVVKITTREVPVYALVVAKQSPKLKQVSVAPELANAARPPAPPPPPPPSSDSAGLSPRPKPSSWPGIRPSGPNQITATACRMSWFVDWLRTESELADRPVIDRTALSGNYDFTLNGIVLNTGAPPVSAATSEDPPVSIFTALQEQLGLKLVSEKAPVQVLVVDHVGQPSPN